MQIRRPSQSRAFSVLIWIFALLTYFTALLIGQNSMLVSALKGLGCGVICVFVTALAELVILGPIRKDEDDE